MLINNIDTYYYNHNVNYRINLKSFFLYRAFNLKKQINFFKKNLFVLKNSKYNLNIKISFQTYFEYILKQNYIYLNIINKKFGSLKINGYQYIYPAWDKLMITGTVLKIKRNNFSSIISISNYVDKFYIKRYVYLFSNLICYIINQEYKSLIKKIKYIKHKSTLKQETFKYRYFFFNKNLSLIKWFKFNKYFLHRKYKYNKHSNKKYKFNKNYYIWFWIHIWFWKFKRWKIWFRRFPLKFLKRRKNMYDVLMSRAFFF